MRTSYPHQLQVHVYSAVYQYYQYNGIIFNDTSKICKFPGTPTDVAMPSDPRPTAASRELQCLASTSLLHGRGTGQDRVV